jgi:hypothetical protein
MTSTRWRTACFVLGGACTVLLWRDCNQGPAEPRVAHDCPPPPGSTRPELARHRGAAGPAEPTVTAEAAADDQAAEDRPADGLALYGVQVPGWAMWLAPHPGEDLRAYRDRMLPLAVAAIAPQRARVTRSRESFAQLVHLDARQRAELDAATDETATSLQDRLVAAAVNGELSPAAFKPMAGVGLARDLLDIVGRGNRRFLEALRADQRAALAQHPFDFGDYLVFSTHWEDALQML